MLSTLAVWMTILYGWMHLGTTVSGAKLVGIRPPQIYAEAERPLEASCTLNDKVNHNLTSHDLAFRWKFRRTTIPISPNYVQTPNATTAVLLLPKDQVGPDRDKHLLSCYVGDSKDSIYVRVGFKPKPLSDLQVTADNWHVININWTKEENPSFTTRTFAYWKMGRDDLFKRCKHQYIEEKRKYHCWVEISSMELDPTTYFTIKVNSSNSIGDTTTQEEIFYLHEINKPGKINYITLDKVETTWAKLGWESPAHGRSLVYEVNTTCLHSTQMFKVESTDIHLYMNATGLIAGTQCEVAIAARSVHGILWSNPYTMDLLTKESVPLALPLTTRGSFDLTKLVDKTDITLYWQPVPAHLRGGHITKYKVIHWSEEDGGFRYQFEFPADDKCQRLITIARPDAESNLSVVAKTSVGYNTSIALKARIIVQPQSLIETQKPANVTALINENNVTEVRWVGHAEGDYTGYWCESDGKTCLSTINWTKHISSPWTVSLSPLIDHRRYRFGVSLDLPTASSGISWSDCVYQMQARSGPPTVEKKTTLGSIILKLKHASRCSVDAGFIYAYFITYCTSQGNKCDGPVKNLTVSRSEKTTVVEMDGLEENTKYRVTVYSVTTAGFSLTPVTDTITTTAGVKTEIQSKLAIFVSVGVVLLVLLCVGMYCACTKCRQACRKTVQKLHIPIKLPDEESQKEMNSDEVPLEYTVPYHNLKRGSASPDEPTQNMIGSYTNVARPPKLPPRMESISRGDNDSGISFNSEIPTRPPLAPSPVTMGQLPEIVSIRKGGSTEDILDQNQKNVKKDEDYDYKYAPTLSLAETIGESSNAASSSESASSSGDESDHYKEAAILIRNPGNSPSNLSKGSNQEGPDLSGSSYGYKPVLLQDVGKSSTPLLSNNALTHPAMESKIGEPRKQAQPEDGMGINEPVSLDPAVILTMADGDHIDCYNVEDNVSEDNDSDYGYAPNPIPGLVIGTPDNAWLHNN